ncbi:MAG: hypothetical protein JXM69_14250 [Anaerolineae bacterium]|nr:hypothetical protein [Anaerolineae bacterium]
MSAIFATLGVIDKDGDLTIKGAFGEQDDIPLESWGHGYQLPPVGVGRIYEKGDKAIFEGRFFLDSQLGRDNFTALQEIKRTEWSYTFRIKNSKPIPTGRRLEKLLVKGVAPVTEGAGIGTATLSVKGQRTWLPFGPRRHPDDTGYKTTAELSAAIEEAETRMRHWEMAELEALLKKDADPTVTMTPRQMIDDIWLTQQVADGHSLQYAQAVLASRHYWATVDAWNAYPHAIGDSFVLAVPGGLE